MTAGFPVDPDTRYAIGLDIGDGESCLLWIDTTDPEAKTQLYRRPRSPESTVLTVLARNGEPPHEWIFGEPALLEPDAIQFEVNFKRMPRADRIPAAVLFAHEFLGEFLASHPEVQKSCLVLVGCPTGWPAEARDAYLRFLRTNGLHVALLPESQSALVHVWDLRRREPDDNVLVVDIGSSTVDVTMVTDLEPVNIDTGTELGCADIDRELAELAQAALGSDPDFRAAMAPGDAAPLLRMACRRAKEAQFTGHELLLHDQEKVNLRYAAICASSVGWLKLLDIPWLVDQRWAGRFRALLEEVATKLPHPPEVVVLTGGGSRMPVTRRITTEVFSPAVVENDATPSLSVGRGLASAGRHQLRALRFRRAAIGIATRPEVQQVLRAATVDAFAMVRDQTHKALRHRRTARWSAVFAAPPGVDDAVRALESKIDETIRPLLDVVCAEHEIPLEQRDLGTAIIPPRVFTEHFVNRTSQLGWTTGRSGVFDGNGDLARMAILHHAHMGARSAMPSAGVNMRAAQLQGALVWGAAAALLIGGTAVLSRGGARAWRAAERGYLRHRDLAELARRQLPDELVATLERELAEEVARLVEERIAPLERMVR